MNWEDILRMYQYTYTPRPRQAGKTSNSTSNTFRRSPEPREGFIDAREALGVPCITTLEA